MIVNDNFIIHNDENVPGEIAGFDYDTRHCVSCCNSTDDIKNYINYLKLTQYFAFTAKKKTLLYAGFIPAIFPPSFAGSAFHEKFEAKLMSLMSKVNCYRLPAVSFRENFYKSEYPDVWVSRMDLADILQKKPHEIRIQDIFREITEYDFA
jgi:hypothetical protein